MVYIPIIELVTVHEKSESQNEKKKKNLVGGKWKFGQLGPNSALYNKSLEDPTLD